MRIKLDENLPTSLVAALATLGHDVDSVLHEGLSGRADPDVWRAAQDEDRFFVTQDLDFSDVRRFRPGTHAGLLLVRLTKPGRRALTQRIIQVFTAGNPDNWTGSFVVATDIKLRVASPKERQQNS